VVLRQCTLEWSEILFYLQGHSVGSIYICTYIASLFSAKSRDEKSDEYERYKFNCCTQTFEVSITSAVQQTTSHAHVREWSIFRFVLYLNTNTLLLHGKKRSGCCNIDENRIEQCFAADIVHSCQQYWTGVTPDSDSTILFNIVDKCEQRGQQNIVQSC
jgi:hypothetical protein